MPAVQSQFRSFKEAVDYFERKVNLPTTSWRDLRHGAHTRAFTVAGAIETGLLEDFYAATQKAIEGKVSYDEFRRDFERIVAKHGWQYNGSPGWRSRVIYHTNVRTAYQAGRYLQMTQPGVVEHMPWWMYDHTTINNPREEHKAWDNLVLRYDDPFWKTHYPPNGWGCNCTVRPLSDRQLRKLGKTGPDPSPGPNPGGVPDEWQYNVGETAWGRPVADAALRDLQDKQWTSVPPNALMRKLEDWARPERVPAVAPRAAPLATIPNTEPELREAWRRLYGEQTEVVDPAGGRVVLSERIIDHWLEKPNDRLDGRQRYLPLLRETIEDPFEIWAGFAVNARGGYGLRRYYIRVVELDEQRSLTLIATADRGSVWTDFDFFRGSTPQKRTRTGHLVWGQPWP